MVPGTSMCHSHILILMRYPSLPGRSPGRLLACARQDPASQLGICGRRHEGRVASTLTGSDYARLQRDAWAGSSVHGRCGGMEALVERRWRAIERSTKVTPAAKAHLRRRVWNKNLVIACRVEAGAALLACRWLYVRHLQRKRDKRVPMWVAKARRYSKRGACRLTHEAAACRSWPVGATNSSLLHRSGVARKADAEAATKATAGPAAEATTILCLQNVADDIHQHLGVLRGGAVGLPGLLRIAALTTSARTTLTLTLISVIALLKQGHDELGEQLIQLLFRDALIALVRTRLRVLAWVNLQEGRVGAELCVQRIHHDDSSLINWDLSFAQLPGVSNGSCGARFSPRTNSRSGNLVSP
ncbi:hypothetical protein XAP6164_2320018 [Xanthomonas phaseoli pv. phaseoli]|nr:hypothetical protein XAP6164_2320018 [Xanthomonas phaseoli pv. phaseoli]